MGVRILLHSVHSVQWMKWKWMRYWIESHFEQKKWRRIVFLSRPDDDPNGKYCNSFASKSLGMHSEIFHFSVYYYHTVSSISYRNPFIVGDEWFGVIVKNKQISLRIALVAFLNICVAFIQKQKTPIRTTSERNPKNSSHFILSTIFVELIFSSIRLDTAHCIW